MIRFHATNQNAIQVRYDALEDWLAEQFAKNAPWDEIATALITATGRVDENGAVSFALAHEAKPVELAGEVSRIFLGVQIQCAQCHDHKTDSLEARAVPRVRRLLRRAPGQAGRARHAGAVARLRGRGRRAGRGTRCPTWTTRRSRSRSPPGSSWPRRRRTPLPESLDAVERRALAASYVTGQDNPWFARAYVNRIWYALMGEAFYDAGRRPRARSGRPRPPR